jgi:hydrogenase expression/formation protein HypE
MTDVEHIQLAHGGGGQLTAELIEHVILPALGAAGSAQDARHLKDAAVLPGTNGLALAMTTDSYVVQPLEFPGGDIGKLAVCGTVNDLAVMGATPLALTLALVLEEGLEIVLLRRVLASAGAAAREAGAAIVTGDTKVVERGGVAGMIINTTGLGTVLPKAKLGFGRIAPGDRIVLSGPLGEHGLAVLSKRKGLSFSAELVSDCAPLNALAAALVEELGDDLKFMRDPTRSGLAATLVDVAASSGMDVEIDESSLPVNRTARAAAEMLGLDLMSIANEGKLVAVVAPRSAQAAVSVLRKFEIARHAAVVGTVRRKADQPLVEMITDIGGRRIVQMPYGEELPRIC